MTVETSNPVFASAIRSIPPKEIGNRGFFPSNKVDNGIVEYESQIERDFFILLDHAGDVVKFQHQPVLITYITLEGKTRRYTPDVYVKFINGLEIIVEIKDEKTYQTEKSKFEERWKACSHWCKDHGYSFIVITDLDIRTPRFGNIWFTLGPSKVTSNERFTSKVNSLIPEDGIEYNTLCHLVSEDFKVSLNKASQIISYGIYHGIFFIDTFSEIELNKITVVRSWLKEKNNFFKPLWLELDDIIQRRDINDTFRLKPKSLKNLHDEKIIGIDKPISGIEIAVKEFLRTPSRKRDLEWRTRFEEKYNIKKSKIYYWVKRYQEVGKSGLEKRYVGRKSKWDDYTIDKFELARKEYLKQNSSVKQIYEVLIENNWDNDYDMPSYSSFWRYIKKKTSYYDDEISKKGKRRGKEMRPSLGTFKGATMPMQVVQFDNTPFDLFLKGDNNKSIGTPNLCAAIDVYTRQITGFELTLNAINRQSILETLVQSITPKHQYLENYFNIDENIPEWKIEGFPVLILVDNGMDYRSKDVKRFCMEYDIILEFAPIRNPRYKAYIESWFQNLGTGIYNEMNDSGYRHGLRHRVINTDIDPEKNVIFNSQQSELWLTSWILDEYHNTNPYNDGLPSPALRYEDYEKGLGNIILPQPRDPPVTKTEQNELILNALVTEDRTLKDNIEFVNLKYSSPALISLHRKFGRIRVVIMYDMRDIRTIWVKHPVTHKPLQVELTNGWATAFIQSYDEFPISKSFWKKEVALIRKNNRNKLNLTIFRKERGRKYRQTLRESARIRTKRDFKEKAVIDENSRKLKNKPYSSELPLEREKKIIPIDEEGKFIRQFVPVSKDLQEKMKKRKGLEKDLKKQSRRTR